MSSVLLTADRLTRTFSDRVAVRDLSLSVAAGEVVALLGPNGAGKTTTMRMLAGLILPTSGSASVLGHDIVTDPLRLREHVGYMPESDCLPLDVTASDFVAQHALPGLDVPVGLVTGLVGGGYLLWLLTSSRPLTGGIR